MGLVLASGQSSPVPVGAMVPVLLILATIVVLLGLLLVGAVVLGRLRYRRLDPPPRAPEPDPPDAWEEAGRRLKQ